MAMVVSGLTMTSGAQAALVIDDFADLAGSTGLVGLASDTATFGVSPSPVTTTLTGSAFSDDRILSIALDNAGVTDKPTVAIGFGEMGISNGSIDDTTVTSGYSSNVGGTDFNFAETSGDGFFNAFVIDFLSGDKKSDITIRLTLDAITQTKTFAGLNNAPSVVTPISFDYALWGDVSNVNDITLEIDTHSSMDSSYANFRAYGAAAENVPEPTFIALLASGLAAFGFGRRKRA